VLNWEEIYDDLDAFIIAPSTTCALRLRPVQRQGVRQRWEAENGPFGIEKVIQGAKTESVPLGELKKLSEDRNLFFDES
jgi:hypothetical protein